MESLKVQLLLEKWLKKMEDIRFNFRESVEIKKDDVVLLDDLAEILQNIKIEIVTNENDLFYNEEFGFSLIDFLHREINDMLLLEIKQRIITKLSKRDYINVESITVEFQIKEEKIFITVKFLVKEDYNVEINVLLDRTVVEVV